jgi:hypothetical protein
MNAISKGACFALPLVVLILWGNIGAALAQATGPTIHVLSGPAAFVTGGAALVEIVMAPASSIKPQFVSSSIKATINGVPIPQGTFDLRNDGHVYGLLSGLVIGDNVLHVRTPAGEAQVTLTNHPKNNNVLVAPFEPIICRTVELGLGPPTSADCDASTQYSFLYKSTDPTKTALQPYDPNHPPADVAQTITDQGNSVPFIVRDERGVIDRFIYDIVVLFDPAKPWTAVAPQAGWNHKVLVRFDGGCTPGHVQAADTATGVANPYNELGKGFAVVASGVYVLGNHCDTALSAEGVLTVKSHLAVTYGRIRYTISDGSSGGSIQQHGIANSYPALLDGLIMTGTSFPDIYDVATEAADCFLLENYFNVISPGLWPTVAQKAAVMGTFDLNTCNALTTNLFGLGYAFHQAWWDPTVACAYPDNARPPTPFTMPPPGIYNATTNPGGVRCTIQDAMPSIFGRRADGFANRPYDNVGVQYGLAALRAGTISMPQFIDLNAKIGGIDIDNNLISARSQADVGALGPLYRSGQLIDGKQLANVPIIAWYSYNNQIFHDSFQNYVIRARLIAANGSAANQAIWTFLGSPGSFPNDAFTLMDQWLARIESDTGTATLAAKVLANKPAAAIDTCLINGQKVTDVAVCSAQYPNFADPRIAAGGALTDALVKCQLKSVAASDYSPATPTAQDLAQIRAIFPNGVCDLSQPGVGQQPTVPWFSWL